jgi:hypothetical protein
MGDVKRSGKTYEERKAIAIARQKVEGERRAAIKAEIEASKTPEQRLREREDRHTVMNLMMMWGMAGLHGLPTPGGRR